MDNAERDARVRKQLIEIDALTGKIEVLKDRHARLREAFEREKLETKWLKDAIRIIDGLPIDQECSQCISNAVTIEHIYNMIDMDDRAQVWEKVIREIASLSGTENVKQSLGGE